VVAWIWNPFLGEWVSALGDGRLREGAGEIYRRGRVIVRGDCAVNRQQAGW
jgi:hypothetical protein